MKRNRRIICLFIMIVFVFMCQNSYAEQSKKYQDLLFPDGMPVKEGWDGKKREAVYEFYSEIRMPNQSKSVVLYSTKTITGYSDDLYSVYLSSIISKEDGKLHVVSTDNITNYIATYTEVPGNFYQMDGVVELFKITETQKGVHINLWAVISGSASTSSSTDVFYFVEPNFEAKPLLVVEDSSLFLKLSRDQLKAKNTYLYYGDLDGDKIAELVFLETEYVVDASKNIDRFSFSPHLKVYHLGEKGFVLSGEMNVFKNDVSALKMFEKSRKIYYPRIPQVVRGLFGEENEK
ncbi:hypothetical protein KA005_39535 [bacterium]|nr:hypothetical protein [bacterium]